MLLFEACEVHICSHNLPKLRGPCALWLTDLRRWLQGRLLFLEVRPSSLIQKEQMERVMGQFPDLAVVEVGRLKNRLKQPHRSKNAILMVEGIHMPNQRTTYG